MNNEIEIHHGSGNVFADIGLKDADELYAHAKIGIEVLNNLQHHGLKQHKIASLFDIKQSEVSQLLRGQFHRFSQERLLEFIKKLEQEDLLAINQPDHVHSILTVS